MSNFIVIDIGGTYMKYGLVSEDGTFKQRGKMPTRAPCLARSGLRMSTRRGLESSAPMLRQARSSSSRLMSRG